MLPVPGGAVTLVIPHAPTTVPHPRFMVRKDGMVMAFNQEIWDVDQRTKKMLRCVRDLPKSYADKLNALKIKSQRDTIAQVEYARQFHDNEKLMREQALARAEAAQNAMIEVGDGNLVAEQQLADHLDANANLLPAFDYMTASREDLIAYARDEMFVDLDENADETTLRREVAEMLGAVPPPAPAAPPQRRAPPPKQAATAAAAPAAPARRPAPAIGAME